MLTPCTYEVGTGSSSETCTVDVNSCGETVGMASYSLTSLPTSSTTPPPSGTAPTTPTCPAGTAWNGSACIGTTPPPPAIGATFTIGPKTVLQDQPGVDTAAYQEVLIAGIQVHTG